VISIIARWPRQTFRKLGSEYYDQEHCQDALECLRKALEIYQACKKEECLLAVLYYHLGKTYYHSNIYDNALLYYNKCLRTEVRSTSKSDFQSLSQTYHAIGETLEKMNDYQMALKNYAKALETILKDDSLSAFSENSSLIEQYQKNIQTVKTFL
jgi:tetratricopeptide (TPR) repeat protein